MPTTPTSIFGSYDSLYGQLFGGGSPIDRLRHQRTPDSKPKKPKPVTDEQLLGIVDQLTKKIDALTKQIEEAKEMGDGDVKRLHARIAETKSYVQRNYRTKWFAPDISGF